MADNPLALLLPRIAVMPPHQQTVLLKLLPLVERCDNADPAWLQRLTVDTTKGSDAQAAVAAIFSPVAASAASPGRPVTFQEKDVNFTDRERVSPVQVASVATVAGGGEQVTADAVASPPRAPPLVPPNEVVLQILSTYGTGSMVGLTEVSVPFAWRCWSR